LVAPARNTLLRPEEQHARSGIADVDPPIGRGYGEVDDGTSLGLD
jgi:hypothetical protein